MGQVKYNLFLDDTRMPYDVGNYTYYKYREIYRLGDWDIVRNYHEFTKHITRFGLPSLISFDHDLGDEKELDMIDQGYSKKEARQAKQEELTGYHCAHWLINYCLTNGHSLPETYVHSMNPVGKENIERLIYNFKKHVQGQ